jgi:cyclase
MTTVRLIARLDVKGPHLIKGVQLEGLRVIGDPHHYATRYYEQGIDELIYIDVVASLYGRNSLDEIVTRATADVFVPLTVGGGIRSVDDARRLLRSGADKVAINTAAVTRPNLVTEIAHAFGRQCVVLSIPAKSNGDSSWEVYTDGGRQRTGLSAIEWARRGVELGAGEILLTSVDREGTRRGFDVNLVRAVAREVDVPVIASGGMGNVQHMVDVVGCGADAVAFADCLHYDRLTVSQIRAAAQSAGINVRRLT